MSENTHAPLQIDELRNLVAEALELPVEDVTDDAHFVDELEVDSLMALEIVVRLEQRFGVKVSDEELKGLTSFRDVRELMAAKLRDGQSA